jgi:hypothetical protein
MVSALFHHPDRRDGFFGGLTCAVSRFVGRVPAIVHDVAVLVEGDASAVVAGEFRCLAFGGGRAGLGQSQQE